MSDDFEFDGVGQLFVSCNEEITVLDIRKLSHELSKVAAAHQPADWEKEDSPLEFFVNLGDPGFLRFDVELLEMDYYKTEYGTRAWRAYESNVGRDIKRVIEDTNGVWLE